MIDAANAFELLDEVVAEKGADYVAPVCKYFDSEGEPVCIVAHVLVKLDLGLENLGAKGTEIWGNSNGAPIDVISLVDTDVEFDSQAVRAFRGAQIRQDSGEPWGMAVEKTKRELAHLLPKE
jgi:hypothetical protein